MKKTLFLLLIIFTLAACEDQEQQTISVKSTHNELLDEKIVSALLPEKNSENRVTPITHIVLHFSSNALNNPKNPYILEDILNTYNDYGVSAHYLIGREGQIYSLVPEDRVAYHAGKGDLPTYPNYSNRLNDYSIGIELMAIGTKEEMVSMIPEEIYNCIPEEFIGYTDLQYHSLNLLINEIIARHPAIERDRVHIIGHDEYAINRKSDPGSLFKWGNLGF